MLRIYYDRANAVVADDANKTYQMMSLKDAQIVAAGVESVHYYYDDLSYKISYFKEIGFRRLEYGS